MTYVYNSSLSGIKRKPTEEEKTIVLEQEKIQRKWYKKYNDYLHDGTKEKIGMIMMKKIWDKYLLEYREYNRLFNLYIGYCY